MNPIQKAWEAKTNAEKKLQAFGGRIRKNIIQGQKDYKSGKVKKYGSINPFQ